MLSNVLLPDPKVLCLDALSVQEDVILVVMNTIQSEATCPTCEQRSQSVHSRYRRTVADLPWAGIPVRLHLGVRKFFCRNPECKRVIFTERLPTVVAPWARRSKRLAAQQQRLGLDFGGEAASRAGTRLGLPASSDTVLRLVRRAPLQSRPTPRVLGVDDWAWRKGQRYGTLLVDLETHTPIDLLLDRTAETLAEWLQAHPGVEIISRDRAGAYADGATRGAPQAQQVADRFHLLMNLREALEGVVVRQHASVRAAAPPPAAQVPKPVEAAPGPDGPQETPPTALVSVPAAYRSKRVLQQAATSRARRLVRYEQVVALHQQGLSQKAIAIRLDLCRKTVRRWLRAGQFPERAPRRRRVTRLEAYESYLRQRWEAGCHNGAQLWREVCQQGYTGSRTLVADWVAQHRRADHVLLTTAPSAEPEPPASEGRASAPVRSPRQVSWLLVRAKGTLDPEEQAYLERVLAASSSIAAAYQLAQQFRQMVTERQVERLEGWLVQVAESGLPDLQRFAVGLRRDYTAVAAGLSLPWSNGPVEGEINRLKFIKRQGYGRAGFGLLKQRVLAA